MPGPRNEIEYCGTIAKDSKGFLSSISLEALAFRHRVCWLRHGVLYFYSSAAHKQEAESFPLLGCSLQLLGKDLYVQDKRGHLGEKGGVFQLRCSTEAEMSLWYALMTLSMADQDSDYKVPHDKVRRFLSLLFFFSSFFISRDVDGLTVVLPTSFQVSSVPQGAHGWLMNRREWFKAASHETKSNPGVNVINEVLFLFLATSHTLT